MIISMKELICEAFENHYSIPAFNFENFDMLEGIIMGAANVHSPVILQTTEPANKFLGLSNIVFVTSSLLEKYKVRGTIHLDHASNYDIIKECIDAGYSSIMIDYSEGSLDENITQTNKVSVYAKENKVAIEAEVGIVGYENVDSTKTELDELEKYLLMTEVDMLGVSVGNKHGHRIKENNVDFALLKKIKSIANIPLVLHGSSGIKLEDLKQIGKYGICKVNFETQLRVVFHKALSSSLLKYPNDIKVRNTMGRVRQEIADTVSEICIVLGSAQ